MRYDIEVRISLAQPVARVWQLACDSTAWPAMPGAELVLEVTPVEAGRRLEYAISAGLPVRDHHGELLVGQTSTGGTELVFTESFRPRIWGTGGYLRGRRERALIDTAQWWGRENSAPTSAPI